ncbi:hypothetical protein C463_06800 [Halorubrum californiense DSM 19288]|uniref:VanZ-like domain-containing protein n=1 Tax=Halorubrum californiense DSM 19288 TaxID=1227465 RepID=M0EDI9_9EURY|nr:MULTISPECIES: hypothetical protein [Halorubrum]ELZ45108.1 hypothetical protein C463_06800 [Halorubrum californiense DSM 19288]TKX68914.1 hypothetical protein EXE40_11645 [Halorubrum sp. GN11GM_10-3_MGM]
MNSRDEEAAGQGRDPRKRSVDGDYRRAPVWVAGLVLAASVVPVPPWPGAGGGTLPLPTWIGPTAPFHLIGYAALAAFAGRAVAGSEGRTVIAAAVGVAVATAFGFEVELVQAPIPWRSFAWIDAAINAVGAVVGAGIFGVWRTRRENEDREEVR